MTSIVMSVGVMPTSVDCSVTPAQGFGAVDEVEPPAAAVVAGAAVVVAALFELLREHAPAMTHTANTPTKSLERATESPRSRKADEPSP